MEFRSDAVGILYAEEFGEVRAHRRQSPAHPASKAQAPPLTQADIDAACIRAIASAQLAWAQADEARRTAALETMAAGMAELRADAKRHAETVAEALAGTALAAIAAMLPGLAARHGEAEVRTLAASLLPQLACTEPVVVRVHPSLIAPLEAEIAGMDETLAEKIELRAANLPPGDARFDWPDGSLTRDAAAIHRAIAAGFAQLGLLPPKLEQSDITLKEPEYAQ